MWALGVSLLANALYALLAVVIVSMCMVAFALSCKVYRRALITHAMRLNMASQTLTGVAKLFVSSMNAEEKVEQLLRAEGWTRVYLRRRVPVARVGHNREVDLIAVGPVILVIEVKHWRGRVWCNGSRWFQQPDPRSSYTLEFEDVLEDNVIKAAALRRQLENSHRIVLPDSAMMYGDEPTSESCASGVTHASVSQHQPADLVKASPLSTAKETWYSDELLHKQCGYSLVPVVVFTNQAVVLDPATVRAKRHVFTMETFRSFARAVARDGMAAHEDLTHSGVNTHRGRRDGALGQSATGRRCDQPQSKQWLCCVHALLVRCVLSTLSQHVCFLRRAAATAAGGCSAHASFGETGQLCGRRPRLCLRTSDVTLSRHTREAVSDVVDMMRTWDAVYLHNGSLLTGDVQRVEALSAGCEYPRKHLLEMNMRWNVGVCGYVQTLLYNKAGTVELKLVSSRSVEALPKPRNKGAAGSPARAHTDVGTVVFDITQRRKRAIYTDKLVIKLAGTQKLTTVPLIDIKTVSLSKHLYAKERMLSV